MRQPNHFRGYELKNTIQNPNNHQQPSFWRFRNKEGPKEQLR
jgi:hypothetical protein